MVGEKDSDGSKKDSDGEEELDLPQEFNHLKILNEGLSVDRGVKKGKLEPLIMKPIDGKFDSIDEEYFSWYLDELLEAGYVSYFEKYPLPYRLSPMFKYSVDVPASKRTKAKTKRLNLLRTHEYTPDYAVVWTEKARGIFFNSIISKTDLRDTYFIANEPKDRPYSVIEIKPSFDKHNMTRLFTLNQKWLYHDRRVYVQKVIVCTGDKNLFAKTFTPGKYLLTRKKKQPRKLAFTPIDLPTYVSRL